MVLHWKRVLNDVDGDGYFGSMEICHGWCIASQALTPGKPSDDSISLTPRVGVATIAAMTSSAGPVSTVGVAIAIANALHDAVGVRFTRLPSTACWTRRPRAHQQCENRETQRLRRNRRGAQPTHSRVNCQVSPPRRIRRTGISAGIRMDCRASPGACRFP